MLSEVRNTKDFLSYMLSLSYLWDIQMKMSTKQAARMRKK